MFGCAREECGVARGSRTRSEGTRYACAHSRTRTHVQEITKEWMRRRRRRLGIRTGGKIRGWMVQLCPPSPLLPSSQVVLHNEREAPLSFVSTPAHATSHSCYSLFTSLPSASHPTLRLHGKEIPYGHLAVCCRLFCPGLWSQDGKGLWEANRGNPRIRRAVSPVAFSLVWICPGTGEASPWLATGKRKCGDRPDRRRRLFEKRETRGSRSPRGRSHCMRWSVEPDSWAAHVVFMSGKVGHLRAFFPLSQLAGSVPERVM